MSTVTNPSGASKRTYVRLTPATWAEIEVLWEAGEITLAELTDRFGSSKRTLQSHFQKHGIEKGAKGAAVAAAVREEVLREELGDPAVKVTRALAIREVAYVNALRVENLIMVQLKAMEDDPGQVHRVAAAIKALALAAAGLERTHDLKRRALGLDRDTVLQHDLPELIVRDLTEEEIEALRRSHSAGDPDDDDRLSEMQAAGSC